MVISSSFIETFFFQHPETKITCLGIAVEKNAPSELIEKLIQNGAIVDQCNIYGQTPLADAVLWGRPVAVVNLLLKAGASPNFANQVGATPMHYAAQERVKREVFEALIKAGGDVNRQANNGSTPLMIAVACGAEPWLIKLLLDAGADKSAIHPKTGESALLMARALVHIGRGSPEVNAKVVELLS
jgi:ankyrin repeat protein